MKLEGSGRACLPAAVVAGVPAGVAADVVPAGVVADVVVADVVSLVGLLLWFVVAGVAAVLAEAGSHSM